VVRPGHSVSLVVRFADRSTSKRLETYDKPSEIGIHAFVNGLAALDSTRGLAIVVTVHEGASTTFGQIFKLDDGALRRIAIPASAGGEFAYEGSVAHSSRPTLNEAGQFREFAEPQPFPHCMVVRNERTH
jgi:hypothetical protein